MGSRVRIAAAACLVASGLLAGGASASIAFADPPLPVDDSGNKHDHDSLGNGSAEKPKVDPDDKKTLGGGRKEEDGKGDQSANNPGDLKPGEEKDKKQGADLKKQGDDDKKNVDDDKKNGDDNNGDNGVGNPGNGNCGNSGGNGNASGCGGGGGNTDPDDPPVSTTKPPPKEEPPPPSDDPGECDDKNKDHCSPGWPWWPWWPWNPGEPPGPGSSGGDGSHPEVPSGRPGALPQMQLPPKLMPPTSTPAGPTVVDAEPGVGIAAAQLPIAPITLPVIVAPATGLGSGGGSAGAPALPVTPRGVTAEPLAGREPLPANVGSNVAVPAASYRIGYTEYLRNAGLSQVAALAVPGVTGMLVLTCAGGLVGYRQAKAGHAVHASGIARFVN